MLGNGKIYFPLLVIFPWSIVGDPFSLSIFYYKYILTATNMSHYLKCA